MTFINNYKLLFFDKIDSTSSEAIRIAQNVKPDINYAVLAKSQTKARGRSGKNWQSRPGNMHASLLIKPKKDLELLPQLSFVAALAVCDSLMSSRVLTTGSRKNDISQNPLQNLVGKPLYYILPMQIRLKWPNDVLVNGKKISGILLESVKVGDNYYLIIGIGINITYHPDNIDQPTTCLINENLLPILPQALLEILIENFEKYYRIWEKDGFSFIRKKWLEYAYKLHENITVKHQNSLVKGIFQDIDSSGKIILQLPSKKILSFSTADLSF